MQQPNCSEVSRHFTQVLSTRSRPPFSIRRNTIYYWVTRKMQPDWLMIEFVGQNAGDDAVRASVDNLVNYLDSNTTA